MTRNNDADTGGHLSLDDDRGTLVALIGELFEDSTVVLLGIFTALQHQADNWSELIESVARVVNVVRGLHTG